MSEQRLPEELVMEILLRLSLKDLTRFKCVCKAWKYLTDDRCFIEKYRDTPRGNKFVAFHGKDLCFLDVGDANAGLQPRNLECPFEAMIDDKSTFLHCHGMLCVTLKNQGLAVWHPYSKDFKIIPNHGILRDSNILGFGYDRFSDDYKIVTFVDKPDFSTAYIFQFKSNSWKESLRIPHPDWYYRDRKGVFLDQHLYWIAYRSNQDRFILDFDLKTHEHRKLPLPVNNQGTGSSWLGITAGKDLCLTELNPLNQKITISVIKKTRAEPGSWNKVMTISSSCLISSSMADNYDYVVDFVSSTNSDDILLALTGEFAGFYDRKKIFERTKKVVCLYRFRHKKLVHLQSRNSRFLEKYVESPVIKQIFN